MKITIETIALGVSMKDICVGQLFRLANGVGQDSVYIMLYSEEETLYTSFICMNLGTGAIRKFGISHKTRTVIPLKATAITVQESTITEIAEEADT